MIAVACSSTLIWILAYVIAMTRYVPPDKRPDLEFYSMTFVLTLGFATQASIGIFVASRGPIWALVILAAWQLPAIVLNALGVDNAPQLLTGWVGLAAVPVSWAIFAVWYLRTRRIGSTSAGAARQGLRADAGERGDERDDHAREGDGALAARREHSAAHRPCSGSPARRCSSPSSGCSAVSSPPRAVSAMAFGTLSLCAAVTGAVTYSIAARSRGLWLVGGRLRVPLFAWCERLTLRVTVAIVLPFAALGALLWWLMPPVGVPGVYLLVAGLTPAFGAAALGLMQVQRAGLVDALVAASIVVSVVGGRRRRRCSSPRRTPTGGSSSRRSARRCSRGRRPGRAGRGPIGLVRSAPSPFHDMNGLGMNPFFVFTSSACGTRRSTGPSVREGRARRGPACGRRSRSRAACSPAPARSPRRSLRP